MLGCVLGVMLLGASIILFAAFLAWVLNEHVLANRYRDLMRLHGANHVNAPPDRDKRTPMAPCGADTNQTARTATGSETRAGR